MDGLLLNTEDTYTLTLNEILAQYGKGPLTWDLKIRLQGLPGDKAGRLVIDHYQLPLTVEEYEKLNLEIQSKKWSECNFLPGALELLQYLHFLGIPTALCTSSTNLKYEQKTSHLKENFKLFDAIITGDDSRIPLGRGKPSPDIWQVGLRELNEKFNSQIKPEECLVFEDGVAGVRAGVTFGAYVIWVPHPEAHEHLGNKDEILNGRGTSLYSLEKLDKSKVGL